MNRLFPDDPLAMIRRCVAEGKIYWTYHVTMRLRDRFIPRRMIAGSVETYEIIESCPDDKYLPSYLVYAVHEGLVFHVLFALDEKGDNVRIVTAYRPSPEMWSGDLKRRKSP